MHLSLGHRRQCRSFAEDHISQQSVIYRRPLHTEGHIQKVIYRRPLLTEGHLQKTTSYRRSLQKTTSYRRSLQKITSYRRSFTEDHFLQKVIYRRPLLPEGHLQKTTSHKVIYRRPLFTEGHLQLSKQK